MKRTRSRTPPPPGAALAEPQASAPTVEQLEVPTAQRAVSEQAAQRAQVPTVITTPTTPGAVTANMSGTRVHGVAGRGPQHGVGSVATIAEHAKDTYYVCSDPNGAAGNGPIQGVQPPRRSTTS